MLNEFKKFIMRGNFVDMAIGFTVGAAFSTVAKSIVNDIIMPPVGLVLGKVDFSDLFWVLRAGDPVGPYPTVEQAQKAGAVTLNYGAFINNVVALLIVAAAMFAIVRMVNRLDEAMDRDLDDEEPKPEEPAHKKCPYCRTQIPFKAVRCPQCTTRLEGFSEAGPGKGPAPAAGASASPAS